jgi:hypothetical protein
MSSRATSWVLDNCHHLSSNERWVLVVIADEADREGLQAYPSTRRIAERASLSPRTVQRVIPALEAAGELLVLRPASQGRGQYNRYALTLGRDPDDLARQLGWPPKGGQGDTLSPRSADERPLRAHTRTGGHTGVSPDSLPEPSEEEKGGQGDTLCPVDNSSERVTERGTEWQSVPRRVTPWVPLLSEEKGQKGDTLGAPNPLDPKTMAMAMGAAPVEKRERPPTAVADPPGPLAAVASALSAEERHQLWSEGAGGRATLAARLDELLAGGWSQSELVAELARPLPPSRRSVTAVVLARARALDVRPPQLAAAALAGATADAARSRELYGAACYAWNLAGVLDGYTPAEVDDRLAEVYCADAEALEAARRAVAARAAGQPFPSSPGGDHP